jgi:NAD dependent epimerase/dehydratase
VGNPRQIILTFSAILTFLGNLNSLGSIVEPSPLKILVTGADGFIGSHLTESLVRAGHDVRAFVYYNSFNSWGWLDHCGGDVRGKFEVLLGDVRDPVSVRGAVKGCDAVAHLAALIGIPYSYTAAASYVDTNVTGTLNILEAAREYNVTRVIHTSTSEVYGTAQSIPITENHPLHAQSPYAATKIAADQMALSYHRSFDLPVSVVRPFNTFGPRQSMRAVIPTIINQAQSGKGKISLGALSPTRDFNYVSDTVRGFEAALGKDGIGGETINLATGFDISIGDTAEMILDVMGVAAEIISDEVRVRPAGSEVERLCGDGAKAGKLLGWAPAYSNVDGFRRAITETVSWYRDQDTGDRNKSESYVI